MLYGIAGGFIGVIALFVFAFCRDTRAVRRRGAPNVLRFIADRGGSAFPGDVYRFLDGDALNVIGHLIKLGAITVDQVPPREIILTDVGRSLIN